MAKAIDVKDGAGNRRVQSGRIVIRPLDGAMFPKETYVEWLKRSFSDFPELTDVIVIARRDLIYIDRSDYK